MEGGAPDRVPVSTYELVGFNSHSWENQEPSYAKLMDAIRQLSDCVAMWNPGSNERFLASSHHVESVTQSWREGDFDVTRRTIQTRRGPLTQLNKAKDDVKTSWCVEHLCKTPDDVWKALSVPYEPVSHTDHDLARIQAEVGDDGIVMSSIADPLLLICELMEFGEFTVWAMTEPDEVERAIAIVHERCMQCVEDMLRTAPADLYRICGPEYATPPYLPPELFRRFVVPFDRQLVELIHRHGRKARLHCHGRIGRVLESIAEIEPDALDPIEGPPDGDIELSEVKRRVGSRMCLFGNVQLRALESWPEQQVRHEVRRCMDAAKAGGGYVLMPTAAPINVPLAPQTEANYLAYLEEARRTGSY